MKLHTASGAAVCMLALALFGICSPGIAQTREAPTGARTFEDILKVIPQQDFLKLRGNRKAESAMELSQMLIQNEVGKQGTFAVKVAKAEPWQFPSEGIMGTRILAEEERIRMGSVSVATSVYIYVRAKATDTAAKWKRGQKIVVTGTVSRCDLTATDGPVLNIDINTDSVSPAAR